MYRMISFSVFNAFRVYSSVSKYQLLLVQMMFYKTVTLFSFFSNTYFQLIFLSGRFKKLMALVKV